MLLKLTIVLLIVISPVKLEPPNISCQEAVYHFRDKGYFCQVGKESPIGKGSSGIVFLVYNNYGETAVVKVQNVLTSTELAKAQKEASLLMSFSHPNIISLKSYLQAGTLWFTLIEYAANGALDEFIKKYPNHFTEPSYSLAFIRDAAKALHYIHTQKRKLHADIKTANIAVDANYNPKIIDFDMAQDLGAVVTQALGTPYYMDPRLWSMTIPNWDTGTEVYSLGVTLYNMAHGGKVPFEALDLPSLKKKVLDGIYTIGEGIDLTVAKLIVKMMQYNANNRITLPEVVKVCDDYLKRGYKTPVCKTTIYGATTGSDSDFILKSAGCPSALNQFAQGVGHGVVQQGKIIGLNGYNYGGQQAKAQPQAVYNGVQYPQDNYNQPQYAQINLSPVQNVAQNYLQPQYAQANYIQPQYAQVNYNPVQLAAQNYFQQAPGIQGYYNRGYRQRMMLEEAESVESVTPFEWVVFAISLVIMLVGVVALLKWFASVQLDEPLAKQLDAAPAPQTGRAEHPDGDLEIQVA